MAKLSMMVEHGEVGNERHNLVEDYRRSLENVAVERTPLNVALETRTLEDVYAERFSDALEAYNAAQVAKGKPGRQIPDYLAHIRKSKQEHAEYEMVVQIGNRGTNPATDPACRELSEAVYRDWLESFRREFPQLEVREAVIHMDEATPHMHVKYVPFSTGNKRGLETRNSLGGALRQMGYKTTTEANFRYMKLLEEAGAAHGVIRLEMGIRRGRLSVERYKAAMRNGENLDYYNDPALIQAVLELQDTVRDQQKVIDEYHEALVAASKVKVTNTAEVRNTARSTLDRNRSALDAIREKMELVREVMEIVKARVKDFVLNPVPRDLQEKGDAMRDEAVKLLDGCARDQGVERSDRQQSRPRTPGPRRKADPYATDARMTEDVQKRQASKRARQRPRGR